MALRLQTASNQFVLRTSGLIDRQADYTVGGWVTWQTANTNRAIMFLRNGLVGEEYESIMTDDSSTTLQIRANGVETNSTKFVSDGERVYVALRRTGTVLHLIIGESSTDFVPFVGATYEHDNSAEGESTFMAIGSASDTAAVTPDATVQAWKLWQRALTVAEISAEMRQAMPISGVSLHSVYPFPGGPMRLSDFSGKGRDLTSSGSPSDGEQAPVAFSPGIRIVEALEGGSPPSGDIAGSSAGTSTASADIDGPGLIAGSAAGVATASASVGVTLPTIVTRTEQHVLHKDLLNVSESPVGIEAQLSRDSDLGTRWFVPAAAVFHLTGEATGAVTDIDMEHGGMALVSGSPGVPVAVPMQLAPTSTWSWVSDDVPAGAWTATLKRRRYGEVSFEDVATATVQTS
jgi:hypothetical protein